jgi:broad specificity phosphatase PhoE
VPGGETASQVAARADRVLTRARVAGGDVVVFSHGHLLRVLAARWLGLDAAAGRFFALSPGTIGVLGWEREQAVISGWNEAPSALPPGAPQSP